jgi:hypothetical protein
MPKPDVDVVTLVATQELPDAVGLTASWYVGVANPALGNKITNKSTVTSIGTIISEQIGSGVVVPDRVYIIQADLSVWVNGVPDPSITISNDGTGRPRILEDDYLDGKDWSLFQRGVEYMEKGNMWQNDVAGGGFRLTQVGDEFMSGQRFFLIFKPQISNVIVTPDAIARFTLGEVVLTTSSVASAVNDRKLILLQGATTAAISYELRAAYPENVLCVIETGGGTNKQSVITAPAGQTLWRGGTITRHVMGQVDYLALVRIGTVWRVVTAGDRWKRVGHMFHGGMPGPDVIVANGQTLAIADYPGLDDYCTAVNAYLPGSVITVAAWNAGDKGKWARDTVGGIIKCPDTRGQFIRSLDLGAGRDPDRVAAGTGSISGSYQQNQNKEHDHANGGYNELLENASVTGNGTVTVFDPPTGSNQPDLRSSAPLVPDGGAQSQPENLGFPYLISI